MSMVAKWGAILKAALDDSPAFSSRVPSQVSLLDGAVQGPRPSKRYLIQRLAMTQVCYGAADLVTHATGESLH